MRDKEYDSFGPWVYEIDGEHTMPPLFLKYYTIEETPLMLFKIPVKEERRNLRPGMNMYDFVIGLYNDYICIMSHEKNRVITEKIDYSEIKAVTHSVRLLEGMLILYTDPETITINYNTSSDDVISKAVEILRPKIRNIEIHDSGKKKIKSGKKNKSKSEMDFYNKTSIFFRNMLKGLEQNEKDMVPVLYQERMPVEYKKYGILNRVLDLILKPELLSGMVISLPDELLIIGRGNSFNKRNLSVYRNKFTYIPYKNITSAEIKDHQTFQKILQIRIGLGKKNLDVFVEAENPDLEKLLNIFPK